MNTVSYSVLTHLGTLQGWREVKAVDPSKAALESKLIRGQGLSTVTFVPFQIAPSILVTVILVPALALTVRMVERVQSTYVF